MHAKKIIIISAILAVLMTAAVLVILKKSALPIEHVTEQAQTVAPSNETEPAEQGIMDGRQEADFKGVHDPLALKKVLANYVKSPVAENIIITHIEMKGGGLYGRAGFRDGPTGFHFFASVIEGMWRIDYAGQDAIPCRLVIAFDFDEKSISHCWDEELQRLQENKKVVKATVNKCGNEEQLRAQIWYRDFVAKAEELDRSNPEDRKCRSQPSDIEVDCAAGKIRENDLGDVCYLADQNIIVALVRGEYLGPGFKLLKYDILSGQLTVARREDFHGGQESAWFKFTDAKVPNEAKKDRYNWVAPPRVIEQATGDTVIMTGRDGDAGCGVTATYSYDISDNYISVTKFCNGCVDYQTDKYEETCTEMK